MMIQIWAHQSAHPGLRQFIHLSPVLVLTAGPEQGIRRWRWSRATMSRRICGHSAWSGSQTRCARRWGATPPASGRSSTKIRKPLTTSSKVRAPAGNFLTQRFYQSAQHDAPIALFSDPAVTPRTHQTIIHVHPDAGTGRSEALLVFVDESAPPPGSPEVELEDAPIAEGESPTDVDAPAQSDADATENAADMTEGVDAMGGADQTEAEGNEGASEDAPAPEPTEPDAEAPRLEAAEAADAGEEAAELAGEGDPHADEGTDATIAV